MCGKRKVCLSIDDSKMPVNYYYYCKWTPTLGYYRELVIIMNEIVFVPYKYNIIQLTTPSDLLSVLCCDCST